MKLKTPEPKLQLFWDKIKAAIKKVGGVVSPIISLVNRQYSFLVKLLRVLTVMFARKRLINKRLLLLMNSYSKMQNRKKGSRCSPPCF